MAHAKCRGRRRRGHWAPQHAAPPADAEAAAVSRRGSGRRRCGCARGGRTLRVFSNWLLMRVIMPSAAMNDSRDSTCAPPRALRRGAGRSAGVTVYFKVCHPFGGGRTPGVARGPRGAARRQAPAAAGAGGAAARLADALALHAEALDGPVAAADRGLHAQRDDLRPDVLGGVKVGRALGQVLLRLRGAPARP